MTLVPGHPLFLISQPSRHFSRQISRRPTLYRAYGQRVEESLPIPLGGDAAVEHGYHASVALASDQAAKALFELEDGLGNRVLVEGVVEGFRAGGEHGVAGHGEGQLGYGEHRQRVAHHVYTLPERRGTQQHRAW